jgi:hypothetical protein
MSNTDDKKENAIMSNTPLSERHKHIFRGHHETGEKYCIECRKSETELKDESPTPLEEQRLRKELDQIAFNSNGQYFYEPTIKELLSLIKEENKRTELMTRDSEQNRIFAVLRHLNIPHNSKQIMAVRKTWEDRANDRLSELGSK